MDLLAGGIVRILVSSSHFDLFAHSLKNNYGLMARYFNVFIVCFLDSSISVGPFSLFIWSLLAVLFQHFMCIGSLRSLAGSLDARSDGKIPLSTFGMVPYGIFPLFVNRTRGLQLFLRVQRSIFSGNEIVSPGMMYSVER